MAGAHEYVFAPFAVKIIDPETQIVDDNGFEVTVVTGDEFTTKVIGLLTLVILQLSFTVRV